MPYGVSREPDPIPHARLWHVHKGPLFYLHLPCSDPHSGTVCLAPCGHPFSAPCRLLLLFVLCFPCLVVFPQWYASFDPQHCGSVRPENHTQMSPLLLFSAFTAEEDNTAPLPCSKTNPPHQFTMTTKHLLPRQAKNVDSRLSGHKSHTATALMDIRPLSRNVEHKQISGPKAKVGVWWGGGCGN